MAASPRTKGGTRAVPLCPCKASHEGLCLPQSQAGNDWQAGLSLETWQHPTQHDLRLCSMEARGPQSCPPQPGVAYSVNGPNYTGSVLGGCMILRALSVLLNQKQRTEMRCSVPRDYTTSEQGAREPPFNSSSRLENKIIKSH